MICVLTGGTGGAKFVDGLRQVVPPEEITLIVNTGDDLLWWGLYVSPDIDSITYVLSGLLSRERGWGVKGDTFLCLQAMGNLASPRGSTPATAISQFTFCVPDYWRRVKRSPRPQRRFAISSV